jgi:preprotein translocase subunit SecA
MPRTVELLNESCYADDPVKGRLVAKVVRDKRDSAVQEEQRAEVYAKRSDVLNGELTQDQTDKILENVLRGLVNAARTGPGDVDRLSEALRNTYPATVSRDVIAAGLAGAPSSKARMDLIEVVVRDARAAYEKRVSSLGPNVAAELKRRVMLAVMDRLWRVQLRELEDAQDGLALRTVAGGDPFTEYRRTASRLAAQMWEAIEEEFVGYWFSVKVDVVPTEG